MSLSSKELNENEVLKDPDLRKEVFTIASENWDEEAGDFSMMHVHVVMDALFEVVSRHDS